MTEPLYVIEDAAVLAPTSAVLCDLALVIPEGRVTVIVGPGAAGKSSLLYALSGQRMPGDLRLDGSWRMHGRTRSRWLVDDIAFLPQRRAGAAGGTWRDVLAGDAPVVLLDEPASRSRDELLELARSLAAQRGRRTFVVATHHMEFAREVADHVVLVCGGTIDCATDAASFFTAPPTAMAERMISQGNCWPRATLPDHVRWVTPSLAGMARPGLGRDRSLERDLAALAAAGVGLVVSLTEDAPAVELLAAHGLESIHFPIADMGVPRLADTLRLCEQVAARLPTTRVAVHCHAGHGRTGTILAALFVHGGSSASDAIREVRDAIPQAIQTLAQEEFVHVVELGVRARRRACSAAEVPRW